MRSNLVTNNYKFSNSLTTDDFLIFKWLEWIPHLFVIEWVVNYMTSIQFHISCKSILLMVVLDHFLNQIILGKRLFVGKTLLFLGELIPLIAWTTFSLLIISVASLLAILHSLKHLQGSELKIIKLSRLLWILVDFKKVHALDQGSFSSIQNGIQWRWKAIA